MGKNWTDSDVPRVLLQSRSVRAEHLLGSEGCQAHPEAHVWLPSTGDGLVTGEEPLELVRALRTSSTPTKNEEGIHT